MRRRCCLLLCFALSAVASAAPQRVDDHHWTGVERIVAIGDLHGDYESYLSVLRAAGIIDARGRWSGGSSHLVQTGDIPDRGADTRRIIAHLGRLATQAARRGGHVHNLMGNHEAMNVYGDLRYVSAGEFAAFAGQRSAAERNRYFERVMQDLKRTDPARAAALPDDFRERWNREHPLGWIEHRRAWDPRWNPQGELFRWVIAEKVAVQINDLVFVHAGISSDYCGNSLASLSTMAHAALRKADDGERSILDDPRGPLWYRGMAGVEPATRPGTVAAILRRHGARHVVIGHTVTKGVIWPRLDARIIQIDTGMSAAYGRHIGWLEVTPEGLFAGYPNGRLPLPERDDGRAGYLEAVIALQPDNPALRQRLDRLRAPASAPQESDEAGSDDAATCGTSH